MSLFIQLEPRAPLGGAEENLTRQATRARAPCSIRAVLRAWGPRRVRKISKAALTNSPVYERFPPKEARKTEKSPIRIVRLAKALKVVPGLPPKASMAKSLRSLTEPKFCFWFRVPLLTMKIATRTRAPFGGHTKITIHKHYK